MPRRQRQRIHGQMTPQAQRMHWYVFVPIGYRITCPMGGENIPYMPRPNTANKLLKMTWRLYNKEGRANQERGLS